MSVALYNELLVRPDLSVGEMEDAVQALNAFQRFFEKHAKESAGSQSLYKSFQNRRLRALLAKNKFVVALDEARRLTGETGRVQG